MINNTIQEIEKFLNCNLATQQCKFTEYKNFISRKLRGVYIIFHKDIIYYVGKGNIKARQAMHVEKFLGEFKNARDTRGFKRLREEQVYNINDFEIVWIAVESETLIGAVESVLIHKLLPIANDEVILDNDNSIRR